jgi:hypothetical protein
LLSSQIKALEAIIDQKTKEIEGGKSDLQTQLELNKQGFASDVEGERAKIAILEKERAAAIAKQRQAKKAQLLIDSIGQASSMITASSNIIAATAVIPPPFGQILAATAIGAIGAAFAAAKVKAFAAINSGGPTFRTGGGLDLETGKTTKGQLLKGPSHEQ